MFRLIRFEIKKIFSIKPILFLMVLVVLANAIILYGSFDEAQINQSNEMNDLVQLYSENPEDIEKQISEYFENYREVVKQRRVTGDRTIPLPESVYSDNDYDLFSRFNKNIKNFKSTYSERIGESIKVSKSRIAEYQYLGYSDYSFEMLYQKGILESYDRLLDIQFPVQNTIGFDLLLNYNGFAVVFIVALIVGGLVMIIPEHVTGMDNVLRISKKGRLHTIVSKLVAAFLFCVIICLIINLSSLIVIGLKVGFNGAYNPIQMIDAYSLCPFEITVLQGWLISVCISILSGFVFMLIVIAITSIFKSYVVSFLFGFVFASLNYVAANYPYLNNYNFFKNLNFFWSITGFEIIKYWRGIKLFGSCFSIFDSIIIVYLLLLVTTICITILVYCFGKTIKKRKNYQLLDAVKTKFTILVARFGKARKLRVKGIWFYEIRKVFNPFAVIVLLILIAANIYLTGVSYSYSNSYQDNLYHQYMEEYGGEWTEEKAAEIKELVNKYSDIVSKKTSVESDYSRGLIGVSDLANYYNQYYDAEKRLDVVLELDQLSERLRLLKEEGNEVYYVDKQGWEMLKNTNYSYMYFIAVLLILCDVYSREYRTGFSKNQRIMNGFDKVNVAKISMAVLISVVIVVFCEVYQYVYVLANVGLQYPNASSISLTFFDNGNISIISIYLLNFLKKAVILALYGLFVIFVSRTTKKLMVTVIVAAALVFVPILMSYFGLHILDSFSLVNLCSIR